MIVNISTNIDKVLKNFEGLSKQYDFAIAKALTDTAWETSDKLRSDMDTYIDKPNPFTKRGLYVQRATKGRHVAVVGIKDKQAGYLKWTVYGGQRSPANRAIKLPTGVKTNKYGNIPNRYISKIIAKSKEPIKGKTTSYFYGKPRGQNRPVGLYKRTKSGGLVSLVAFNKASVTHRKHFDFFALSRRHILDCIDKNIDKAWKSAVSSSFR